MNNKPVYIVLQNDATVDPSSANRWEELLVLAAISDGAYGAIDNEWLPWAYGLWRECEAENDTPIPTKSLFRDQLRRLLLTTGHRARYPEDYLHEIVHNAVNYVVEVMRFIIKSLELCGFHSEFMPKILTRGSINVFVINLYFYPV